MRTLIYYYSRSDGNISELTARIKQFCELKNLAFIDLCIEENIDFKDRYNGQTPVIQIGPYRINSPFTLTEVEVAVNTVLERDADDFKSKTLVRSAGLKFTRLEGISFWLSKFYVWLLSLIIGLFIISAFIPPFIAIQGNSELAGKLYKIHQVFCHQLAYRSFFLGGEQAFYPREMAGLEGFLTYEDVTGEKPENLIFARDFFGNENLGFKVALCQRDLAIYFSLLLFGIIFQITGKKIRPLKWFFWFAIALLPIAIDGFSQLPGLARGWPTWLQGRESTPLLRVLTGTLFGGGTAWYMYPLMEETMKETRLQLSRKKIILSKLQAEGNR